MPSILLYGCLLTHIHMVKMIITAHKSKIGIIVMQQSLRYGGKNHVANPMTQLYRVLSVVVQGLLIALAFQLIPFSSFDEQITQFILLMVHQINELEGFWSFLGLIFNVWAIFKFRNK